MTMRILLSAVLSAVLSLFPLWVMAEEAGGAVSDDTAVTASVAPVPRAGPGTSAARGAGDPATEPSGREYVECFYVAATKDYTCRAMGETMGEPSAPR